MTDQFTPQEQEETPHYLTPEAAAIWLAEQEKIAPWIADPRPQPSRTFQLSNGAALAFEPADHGVKVNGELFPGWRLDDCVTHFQAIWQALEITCEEVFPFRLHIDGQPVGPTMTADNAVEWFNIIRKWFPACRVEIVNQAAKPVVFAVASDDRPMSEAEDAAYQREADDETWLTYWQATGRDGFVD